MVVSFMAIAILVTSLASAQKPHESCVRKHEKIGCFHEDNSFVRIFTDRMLGAQGNKGHIIDWDHWEVYIHSLACRCNEDALKNGFDYFALRFYGLCYGATRSTFSGPASNKNCLGPGYQPCDDATTTECVGVAGFDYIFQVGRDGGFSNWTETSCSATCGSGTRTRERTCTKPRPSGKGSNCSSLGPSREITACNDGPCKVDGSWSTWSAFGACSRTCGGGNMTRSRQCNNPTPAHGGKNCEGASSEMKACSNDLCPGPAGISKAQELVENFLLDFHKSSFPTKSPSGKFQQAIFAVQRAVANEFALGSTKENLKQRLDDLKKFLKVATEGGNIDFARNTLGKSLFVFMKKKIEDGLPLDQISIAAKDYLKSIKDDVGEKKFEEIMLLNGGATLMFTLDTTGSMKDEINAAKGIASAVIKMVRKFPVDYVLSPFNDPGYGPITYKNDTNKAEFISAISSLRVYGGRDCPEMAFSGMLEAFKANPQLGSPMFVFTDASAKDDTHENVEKLKIISDQYGSSINFFTNQVGCGGAKGIQSYKDIASYTSGQIFPLKKHAEISSFANYVKKSLEPAVIVAKGEFRPAYGRKKRSARNYHEVYIDSEAKTLMVTLDVLAPNTGQHVTLTDPTGRSRDAETTTVYSRVFNIDNPPAGKWILSFPNFVGQYAYVVKIIADKTIDFATYFLHQEKINGPVLSISNPLSAPKSSLILQVSGMDLVNHDSLRASIVNENGQVMNGGIGLSNIGGATGVLAAQIDTPSDKFKIMLSGITMKGHKFQRLSHVSFEKADAIMTVINAGNENTASVSKGSVRISIYMFNQGSSQTYRFEAMTGQGSIHADASNINIEHGKNSTVSFTYFLPGNAASMIGKLTTVTIVATGQNTRSKIQTEVGILFVP